MLITGGQITGMKYTVPTAPIVDTPLFNISSLTNWADATFSGTPGDTGIYKVFDGSQSITTTQIDTSTLANNDITYEIWLRTTGTNSGCVLSKFGTGGYHVSIIEIGNNQLIPGYWTGGSTSYNSAGSITRDVWQHYTVTYQTAGAMKTYYNGSLVSTANLSEEIAPKSYNLSYMWFQLFASESTNFGYGNPLTCDFGEFRLYTRTLTAAEVLQNFTATRSRFGI